MKLFIQAGAVAIAGMLSSCAGGWNADDKNNYMAVCRANASRWSLSPEMTDSYCYCALEKTMNRYPKIPDVVINKDSVALTAELKDCKVMAGAE